MSVPLSPACTTFLEKFCNPITRQAIELESCSNSQRIQQVLQSKLKKTIFGFGGGFSGGVVTKKTCFGKTGHLWLALGPNPLIHFFGSNFVEN